MPEASNTSPVFWKRWALAVSLALVGVSGTLLTTFLNYKAEMQVAELEMGSKQKALSFAEYVAEWDEVELMAQELIATTPIDRFLILKAWNGKTTPKWCTATLQIRASGNPVFNYVHVDLDADYVDRLRDVMLAGYKHWRTDEMPDSLIKSIYLSENVNESMWASIGTRDVEDGHEVHTYVSLSTHGDAVIDAATLIKCRLLISRLKAVRSSYNGHPNL